MTDTIDLDLTVDWLVDGEVVEPNRTVLASLLRHGLAEEAQSGSWSVSLRFVADDEIAMLHGAFLDDPTPTDIITFPYDPDDGERGGDIVISVATARDNAVDAGWPLQRELSFLVLHGLLHILGWNDATPQLRAAMLDRQRAILTSWDSSR